MNSTDFASCPLVTIALPTLNRVDYLQLSLESALGQTYPNIEVIVSNNASTDDTASYLAGCVNTRLRVLQQQEMLSMTENWNACLAASAGEYFLLLSDDDVLEPDAIRLMMAAYLEALPPGIVYCGGSIIDAAGAVIRPFQPSPVREDAQDLIVHFFEGKRDLWFCGVLLRTVDLQPGFPTHYKVACDAAVWMRTVLRRGDAVCVGEQLVRYRLHASLTMATRQEIWRAEYRQLHELVLSESRRAGKTNTQFERRLNSAIQTIDRSFLLGSINASSAGSRLAFLRMVGPHLRTFASFSGMKQLCRAVALRLLPGKMIGAVRTLRS